MFAVVDVETTGFRPRTDRIVEIAIVGLDSRANLEWTWHSVLDPQRDVGPTHVHGLTNAAVAEAPSFERVSGRIAELLRGRTIVGHNINFDLGFINAEFGRLGAGSLPIESACTMRLARGLGIRPAKLSDVCAALGLINQHPHQALGDAMVTAEAWRELSARSGGLSRRQFVTPAPRRAWPELEIDLVEGHHRFE